MKLLTCAACMVVCLSVYAGVRSAAADPTTMPATMPTTAPMVANKFCPVTRDAVDPKVPTVQYKGLTIGFCCEDCVKDFKADPEKYMKNLK
jgi:YHS domain-containing protein